MSQVSDTKIAKEIEIDKNHIDTFVLETNTGTKKVKEKFHQKASEERNAYISNRLKEYAKYKDSIYDEMNKRVKLMMPGDSSSRLVELKNNLESQQEIVICLDENLPVSIKLGFNYLLSEINDNIELNKLNEVLDKFIDKFKSCDIILGLDDFSYTMFTKKYMSLYFEKKQQVNNNIDFRNSFQKIYYECPKIIMQIEYNLLNILDKYEEQLTGRMNNTMSSFLTNNGKTKEDVEKDFIEKKSEYMWSQVKDSYSLVNRFLNKEIKLEDYLSNSDMRIRSIGAYKGDISDEKFKEVLFEYYGCLNELKEFYRYEFILKDLIKRYNEKDQTKSSYEAKLKELAASNKKRIKFNAGYDKSLKKNLFGVINREKQKDFQLKINEEMIKYDQLNNEAENLKFNKLFGENTNNVSSIYDLFRHSLLSYLYLEIMFAKEYGEEENFSVENEFERFIKFLFDKYNRFLRKSNGFVEYNMPELIADSYIIQGLKINSDDITPEKIDETLDQLKYVVTLLWVDDSDLDFNKINFICKYNDIKKELAKDDIELI